MSVTLDQEQYLALASLARLGADTPDKQRSVDSYLKSIEVANGMVRYSLLVQWQETDTPLPPTTDFPEVWPPELRARVERVDHPIAKSDVQKVVDARSKNPTNILVTKDMGGIVGWTKLNDFFIT